MREWMQLIRACTRLDRIRTETPRTPNGGEEV
jgi:hypothetical protein